MRPAGFLRERPASVILGGWPINGSGEDFIGNRATTQNSVCAVCCHTYELRNDRSQQPSFRTFSPLNQAAGVSPANPNNRSCSSHARGMSD